MDDELPEYSVVEVVTLLHDAAHYDGWRVNLRPPAVGDRGTIVDVPRAAGRIGYAVESSGPDGVTVWLGDFEREELRGIDEAITPRDAEA